MSLVSNVEHGYICFFTAIIDGIFHIRFKAPFACRAQTRVELYFRAVRSKAKTLLSRSASCHLIWYLKLGILTFEFSQMHK